MPKILIVDDDLKIIRTIGNTFTTLLKGHLVLTATTANQGLNYIKEEKPEVIIMDVRLGTDSGMDLLEDYPKHIQGYQPHFIVMTAYDDEKVKKRAAELKVDAFLMKPFPPETLVLAAAISLQKYYEAGARSTKFIVEALQKRDTSFDRVNQQLDKPRAE